MKTKVEVTITGPKGTAKWRMGMDMAHAILPYVKTVVVKCVEQDEDNPLVLTNSNGELCDEVIITTKHTEMEEEEKYETKTTKKVNTRNPRKPRRV